MSSKIRSLFVCILIVICSGLIQATEYIVKVRTGSSFGAGTDANVYIRLAGTKGITAHQHKLKGPGDLFENNGLDTFTINDIIDIGDVTSVRIKRDENGWFANWKLFRIAVLSKATGSWSLFHYDRWLKPNRWTTIKVTCETDHKKNLRTGACEAVCGKKPTSTNLKPIESRVTHRSWPWLGIVEFRSGGAGSRICSGSLIASRWVMTTAWCVYGKNPTQLRVRFGADNAKRHLNTEQVIDVIDSFIHPAYHRVTLMSHDLALLQLAHPVSTSNDLQPACVPTQAIPSPVNDPNKKCWFPIWEKQTANLRQVPISLFNLSVCMKLDKPLPKLHDSMLCGTLDRKATGPCTSDPGGPLVCESKGKWYVEGLISTGTDCYVDGPKARIFTNIRFLKSWAQTVIRNNPAI